MPKNKAEKKTKRGQKRWHLARKLMPSSWLPKVKKKMKRTRCFRIGKRLSRESRAKIATASMKSCSVDGTKCSPIPSMNRRDISSHQKDLRMP